jgi:hypothetical protein
LKYLLKSVFVLLLTFSYVNAGYYREVEIISLKKDEPKKLLVKYDAVEKLFKFRWTLFTNGGLVIHRSYDKIVSQNILYLRDKNRSFRVELTPRGSKLYNAPYVLVKFKEFDYETNKAVFELLLSDKTMRIELKYL